MKNQSKIKITNKLNSLFTKKIIMIYLKNSMKLWQIFNKKHRKIKKVSSSNKKNR